MQEERRLPGSKPIGLAIGLAVLFLLLFLPFLIVVVFYLFANVDAVVTGSDFGGGTLNLPVFFTGLVLTVALLVVAMAAAANLIGRGLSPKRRR